jgi:NitT/TauT family transport system substrate-binding protein
MKLFVEGRADAFLGFPPQPQQLRAQPIGRVIANTARDRPWSEYLCCMLVAHREFTATYPAATKRALRAVRKAADICARGPWTSASLSCLLTLSTSMPARRS